MINQSFPQKQPITTDQIVRAYRRLRGKRGKPLALRPFAAALGVVSHTTIRKWERGGSIRERTLIHIRDEHANNGSWQSDFAQDILSILLPHDFEPASNLSGLIATGEAFINAPPGQFK